MIFFLVFIALILIGYYLLKDKIKETQIYKSMMAAYEFSNVMKKPF